MAICTLKSISFMDVQLIESVVAMLSSAVLPFPVSEHLDSSLGLPPFRPPRV